MKIISRACFLLLAFVCLLPGNVSAQQDTAAAGATVYVYRLRDGFAAWLKPSVFCDGKQIVRMRNGRVAKISIPPGSHNFTSTFEGNGLSLDLKDGDTYYIRVDMSKATMTHSARGQVTGVMEGQGKFEVTQLKPSEADDFKVEDKTEKAGN